MKIRELMHGAGLAAAISVVSFGMSAAAQASDLEDQVAAADASAGEAQFRRCMSCHTSEEGGPNRVGPNLWGVVGRQIGSHEGYRYSRALAGSTEIWTLENLNAFIENPRAAHPGTAMSFAGLRNESDRLDILAFLSSLGGAMPEGEVGEAMDTEAAQ